MSSDLRALVAEEIRVHPRVAYQGLFTGDAAAAKLAVTLPPLPCFRKEYAGAITIVIQPRS